MAIFKYGWIVLRFGGASGNAAMARTAGTALLDYNFQNTSWVSHRHYNTRTNSRSYNCTISKALYRCSWCRCWCDDTLHSFTFGNESASVPSQFKSDCRPNMKVLRIIFLAFSVLIASSLSQGKNSPKWVALSEKNEKFLKSLTIRRGVGKNRKIE